MGPSVAPPTLILVSTPTAHLTFTRLANDDRLCRQHPIHLQAPNPDRVAVDDEDASENDRPSWQVLVPTYSWASVGVSDDTGGGFHWEPVYLPGSTVSLSAPTLADARALVVEHLDTLRGLVADDLGEWGLVFKRVVAQTKKAHAATAARLGLGRSH